MNNDLAKTPDLSPAELELLSQDKATNLGGAPVSGGSPIASLILLHALSPQITGDDTEAGNADIGKIMHSKTNEIFDSVVINPINVVSRWVQRESTGKKATIGLLEGNDNHPAIKAARDKVRTPGGRIFGSVNLGDGTEAVETFHLFALMQRDGDFEPVVLKIKLTGVSDLTDLNTRLQAASGLLGPNVNLAPYNFDIEVFGGDYKLKNGLVTKVFKFRGETDNNLALSRIPAVDDDGNENPVRVAAREFLEKFEVAGDALIQSMYPQRDDASDEDEEFLG